MKSIKEANKYLDKHSDTKIEIMKSYDYFYFMSDLGSADSICTRSINNINELDLDEAIKQVEGSK